MISSDEFALTSYIPSEPYGKSVGAIHRGLEILELFSVEQCPLTVNEVSAKLGYPQSSTSVLLHGLHNLGYLIHDRHARTFYPSVRVTFLGMWMHHRLFNEGSLLQLMESLANSTGHVVLLAIRNGLYAQYMHIVSARTSRVGVKPGLMRPICRAAVGKVLLSVLDDGEVRRIARNANAMDSSLAPPVDIDALVGDAQQCRRTGFAYSREDVTPGSSVIAMRIPVDVAGVPLAIGIGVNAHEFDDMKDRVESILQTTLRDHFSPEHVSRDISRSWMPAQPAYGVGRP
ncbi:IclR family transcriptional regulator [Pollutimonas bauzanensis]|uniref:Transcriptional regulator, IclR family n=1 Tax=Pollutimonas bauzanensis TaxID=658167 RepID=A0A1M5ZWX5_9BURK|nr:helix-turn-helix domain-containing protein [Pollutimonas bauzanensis]SHI28740.1 transcriptional regulator, IclR family [Pollutimonas bauzanensis]